MNLNTELRSLLSDLKEHGLLEKYPDLEKVVKRGYRHLESLDSESMPSVAKPKLHDINKHLKSMREALLDSESMPSVVKPKPHKQMHDINKHLESMREALLEEFGNFGNFK